MVFLWLLFVVTLACPVIGTEETSAIDLETTELLGFVSLSNCELSLQVTTNLTKCPYFFSAAQNLSSNRVCKKVFATLYPASSRTFLSSPHLFILYERALPSGKRELVYQLVPVPTWNKNKTVSVSSLDFSADAVALNLYIPDQSHQVKGIIFDHLSHLLYVFLDGSECRVFLLEDNRREPLKPTNVQLFSLTVHRRFQYSTWSTDAYNDEAHAYQLQTLLRPHHADIVTIPFSNLLSALRNGHVDDAKRVSEDHLVLHRRNLMLSSNFLYFEAENRDEKHFKVVQRMTGNFDSVVCDSIGHGTINSYFFALNRNAACELMIGNETEVSECKNGPATTYTLAVEQCENNCDGLLSAMSIIILLLLTLVVLLSVLLCFYRRQKNRYRNGSLLRRPTYYFPSATCAPPSISDYEH